ncbi:unnamed protein product [Malus baccata var. baccata]
MGIKALHVVDSSTFPSTPASHPKRFYMMFGRYVGQKILQERSDQGETGIWTSESRIQHHPKLFKRK